jgi:subtilase family serine protease
MARPPRSLWPALALSVALVGVGLPSTAIAVEARVAVAGWSPIPAADTVVHRSISTTFDVTLRASSDSALTTFIADLSNPASANYHRYLTTTQFARRFGARRATVAAVRSYFAGFGLRGGRLSKGRIVLHLSGSTTDIARAFATPLATVRRADGILAAQFTGPATLPASIARDVAGVAGLSTVTPPTPNLVKPHAIPAVTTPTTCPSAGSQSGTTPNSLGGYTAIQQAQVYGLSTAWASGHTGVGQTIAAYELSAYDPADLAVYFNCYGLNPSVTARSVDGGPIGAYDNEPTLDVEQAAVLAPGAAIEIYQGPNTSSGPTDVYQAIADDNTATIVTTSWGTCESDPSGDVAAEQPIFQQMAAQGQTIISAAGDNGSSDCHGITNNKLAVDDPSSQPYVTGVGGLTVSNISPLAQTVWNDGPNSTQSGAGGGGRSALWSRPSWQVAPGINPAETKRLVPDLSTMGDPNSGFIEYFTGTASGICRRSCSGLGWGPIGGTSIGAPILSAIVATAAQTCAVSRLGFINPSLYAMASTGFVDVTTGNNDLFGVGSYSAGPGYDMASGLGSPKPGTFMAGLCPTTYDATKSSFATSSTTAKVNGPGATVTATLHDSNNLALANALVTVAATASGSAANGQVLIDADPSSATTGGSAVYSVTADGTGSASFTVSSDTPGPVAVTVSYAGQPIYSTTIIFASAATPTKPGRPSIAQLTAIVAGFVLHVKRPPSNGGSAVTSYQYSLNGGSRWSSLARGTMAVRVVNLAKGRRYRVIVRALNAVGAGAWSAPQSIVTRT